MSFKRDRHKINSGSTIKCLHTLISNFLRAPIEKGLANNSSLALWYVLCYYVPFCSWICMLSEDSEWAVINEI